MMYNLRVAKDIVKFLKDGSNIQESITDKTENNALLVELFELCYSFLTKLI